LDASRRLGWAFLEGLDVFHERGAGYYQRTWTKLRNPMKTTMAGPHLFGRALGLAFAAVTVTAAAAFAQGPRTGTENGEWHYLTGDAGASRSSPLNQINASNFGDLEVAWIWRSDNFGPNPDPILRSTPLYVDGILYTVATTRRQVIAIDPATGENLWTFREPLTMRWRRSPRQAYGKGVTYAEVDGRGVIYITTPGFFLWALDAKTGRPIEGFGEPVALEGFSEGVVDLIPGLVGDLPRWQDHLAAGNVYDPDMGIPREIGMVTASAPPIVVNGVIVVNVGFQPARYQTRIENVPGDIMGLDARTGEMLWKFHVIPRPGEFGHETWENDAWEFSGNITTWAPASADPELGLVYLVTNASTIEHFAGHRPGHNLFGGSVLALDVRTGERRWHFQIHHSDQWNYDLPAAPILLDLTVNGQEIPALVQTTKQGLLFAFNRETGEPIWPIEERPVPQTQVPGGYTADTQPYPTLPEPFDPIVVDGLTEEYVMDWTPELRQQAMEILSDFDVGGLYMPYLPINHTNDYINNVGCMGGLNITNPAVADPRTGILYASHSRGCSANIFLEPSNGVDVETGLAEPNDMGVTENVTPTTGTTVVAWLRGNTDGRGLPNIDGIPVYKPMNNQLSAFDMNTGRKIWSVPVGPTPERWRNHPLLQGVDIPETGGEGTSIQMVMGDLLVQTDSYGPGGEPDAPVELHARSLQTGEILASAPLPVPGQYGMMTYMHEGKQYIVVQAGSARQDWPGSLVALALP
jgi:quinoprotein glucose dehydrogenase